MSLKIINLWEEVNKRFKFSIGLKSMLTNLGLFTILFAVIGFVLVFSISRIMLAGASLILEDHERVIRSIVSKGEIDQIQSYSANTNITVLLKEMDPVETTGITNEINGMKIINQFNADLNGKNVVITVSKSLEQEWESVRAIILVLIFVFIIIGIFVLIISGWTIKNMLRPIQEMVKTIRVGKLNLRLDVKTSHDELRDLAETFNELMDKVWDTYRRQDRFVSDASHELRTPLLVIQGYSDLLERWGGEDFTVRQEAIDSIKKEAAYMNKLVERLLLLAKSEQQILEVRTINLPELLEEVIRDSVVMNTGHTFMFEKKQEILVEGDLSLIKQVIRIILDNSIKYSPPPGKIAFTSEVEENNAVITIKDDGIGISKEDFPNIFERFYKADKSRSRVAGSTGLGLSIAQYIVQKHAGTISVYSEGLGKGTKVIIKLPIKRMVTQ
ncbi:HAMP domain-containing histidine kinase [Alkalihalobacillus oceani]|uniref:histidine kinase n=1 Tax=Halalkalibacter oceani TaxID=1653776 RepID=A0A9X2DN28_9BACI|nr:HAMP domain-containing sensor histidine kinase [Halalkalibacter oceani]MCM3713891.1 HAMP domain-containing histidine kinase [Halalkalibacter oceani]